MYFTQAEDVIRYHCVTGVQTCALPISNPRLNRKAETADLRACVVVVELPRYAPALRFEQSADGVAKRRVPAVPHVEWTRGIGRNELHHHRPAAGTVGTAVAVAFRENGFHYV